MSLILTDQINIKNLHGLGNSVLPADLLFWCVLKFEVSGKKQLSSFYFPPPHPNSSADKLIY